RIAYIAAGCGAASIRIAGYRKRGDGNHHVDEILDLVVEVGCANGQLVPAIQQVGAMNAHPGFLVEGGFWFQVGVGDEQIGAAWPTSEMCAGSEQFTQRGGAKCLVVTGRDGEPISYFEKPTNLEINPVVLVGADGLSVCL